MALRDDITLRIGAVTTSARKALDKLKIYASDIASSFNIFGAGLAAGGAAAGLKSVVDSLDDLAKSARSLDITVERLSDLERAIGSVTQLNREDLVDLFQTLREGIGEAVRDPEGAGEVFREIGLAAEDLAKLDIDQALLRIVDALALVRNESRRGAIGAELFEDKWRQVNLIIQEGSGNIEDMAAEMRALGGPTTEMAEQAEEFNGQIQALNQSMSAFAYEIGPSVVKVLKDTVDFYTPRRAQTIYDVLVKDIQSVEARLKTLDTEIESSLDVDQETLNQAEKYRDLLKSMRQTLEELATAPPTDLPEPPEPGGGEDPTVAYDKAQQEAAKKTTETRAAQARIQTSDTRAQARAEGAIWNEHHARINALQDENAEAAERAAQRSREALERLRESGASTERVDFYRDLLGLSDDEVVPKLNLDVSVSERALQEMPQRIRESLEGQQFTIKIVPEIALSPGSFITNRTAAQSGHDES